MPQHGGYARQGAVGLSVIAIIPARYASSRFPGKMLADQTGKPLIQHVHERAVAAKCVQRVIVATDDDRIADAAAAFGAEVAMTGEHPNGTSRLAEIARTHVADIYVNVQGDEPELDPALIDATVSALRRSDAGVGTIASPFAPGEDPADPSIVKVVIDRGGRALYFSRSLIPHDRDGAAATAPLKHVGLYVYRRDALLSYPSLDPTPLEQTERLEQLRWLEHGHGITVAVATAHHHGIDTPGQYEAFARRMRDYPGTG